MTTVELPKKEDLQTLYKSFSTRELVVEESDFLPKEINGFGGLKQFASLRKLSSWKMALQNKWRDVARAYVMMIFYYNKGIPDDPYYISPGRKGQSVEYFPKFREHHFITKDYFDFYADFYFFKTLSIFDSILQIINEYYNLGITVDKVTFKKVKEKLGNVDQNKAEVLKAIYDDPRFQDGKKLRDSITHRLPIGAQGPGVHKEENTISFGISEYTSSKRIVSIANALLDLIIEAYSKVKPR